MAVFTVRPTRLDRQTAAFVADHTDRAIERTAGTLTWGADEHVISVMALGWWIYCRNKDASARRRSDHILLTTIAAAILPHLIKKLVNQERPDRLTIYGRLHGVPLSEKIRRVSFGPCVARRCSGFRSDGVASVAAQFGLGSIILAGRDACGAAGALGERCRCRDCNGRRARTLYPACNRLR